MSILDIKVRTDDSICAVVASQVSHALHLNVPCSLQLRHSPMGVRKATLQSEFLFVRMHGVISLHLKM